MPANTIISEIQAGHPVLDAVAEFREALNRLIDEQKALLLDRSLEGDGEAPRASSPIPPFVHTLVSGGAAESVPPQGHESKPRRSEVPTSKPKTVSVTTNRSPEATTPNSPQDGEDASGSADQRDPRQRLDALARLLDKRLKPTGANPPAGGT